MNQNVHAQIAALRGMTPAQLRDKYLEVFGEATRTGNREFLYKRLAWRIQSQAEGTLSERARQRAAELARDADIRMTMPRTPKSTPGAIPRVVAAPVGGGGGASRLPMPGAILTRKYRGRTIEVTVLPKGFDYDGQVYRSLSAVAKVITGSHWNGHLFFGLKGEGEK
jgi:hypothetical protein